MATYLDMRDAVVKNISLTKLQRMCRCRKMCKIELKMEGGKGTLSVLNFNNHTIELRHAEEGEKPTTHLVDLSTVAGWYIYDSEEKRLFYTSCCASKE